MELKCNPGYKSVTENLITCLENGSWDSKIEECQDLYTEKPKDTTTTTTEPPVPMVDTEFYKDFKKFLFYSCNPKNPENASKLCNRYLTSFPDLSGFVPKETEETHKMDIKLMDLLVKTLETENLEELTAENFLEKLLYGNDGNPKKLSELEENSFRFVLNLFIDLILMDEQMSVLPREDNINNKIKLKLKKVLEYVQKHNEEEDLKEEISESLALMEGKPMNAIQALIHSEYGEPDDSDKVEVDTETILETTTQSLKEISCKTSEIKLTSSIQISSLLDENKETLSLEVDSVKIGSTASFKCAKNFRMVKSMSSVCQEDGSWSEFEVSCECKSNLKFFSWNF